MTLRLGGRQISDPSVETDGNGWVENLIELTHYHPF